MNPPRANDVLYCCERAHNYERRDLRLLVVPNGGGHVRTWCCPDCAAMEVDAALVSIEEWCERNAPESE